MRMAAEFVGKVTEKELEESFQNIKNAYVSQAEEVFEKFPAGVGLEYANDGGSFEEREKTPYIDVFVSPYLTLRFHVKLTFKISNSVRFYDLSFQFENCRSFVTVHFIKNPRTHLLLELLKVDTMSSSKIQNSNNFPRFLQLNYVS